VRNGEAATVDRLEVRALEDGVGVVLPPEVLDHLKVAKGDELSAILTSEGLVLMRRDPDLEAVIRRGEAIMDEYAEAFEALAKG